MLIHFTFAKSKLDSFIHNSCYHDNNQYTHSLTIVNAPFTHHNENKQQVALPPGESCAGWVAVHAIDFYNDVSTIWAVMAEDPYLDSFRPGEGFPSGVEYRWSEGTGKDATTVSVSAPVYIEKVLQWIQDQINDETKFPDDDDEAEALRVFQTPAFAALCGQIFRRLFRVYGIIYSSFFGTLEALQMAPHLNTCFKHFMFFCTEFGLLPEREMEPLEVLVKPIRKQYHLAKGK